MGVLTWVVVGTLVLFAVWQLVASYFCIGRNYSRLRDDLEIVKYQMKKAEKMGATEFEGKRFDLAVVQFNRLARRLRVPDYYC